ncbi:SMI1/KNR4 family protein [Massilia mucilaginosa]|nr:SMI1/KNR4 family protein [Massilia mucilaginosa]
MMDWMRQIVIAHMVKQKIAEVAPDGLWQHGFPEIAASNEDIQEAELILGIELDAGYKEFLRHANGWNSFFQAIDVFGIADLLGGKKQERANEILESLENLEDLCGFSRSELMAFAVSTEDIDLFIISKSNSHAPGAVFWLAGQVIDQFPSMEEWFLAMFDYNRREYELAVEGS